MADGSVTIGVVLDTAAFSASAAAMQGQVSSLAAGINQSLANAFSGASIDASLVAAIERLAAGVLGASASVEQAMQSLAVSSAAAFADSGWAEAGQNAAGAIAGGISAGGGTVAAAVRAIAESAAASFGGSAWTSVGSEMMEGIASGIRMAGAEVVAAIQQVSGEAENAVKEYYDIRSPSGLMRDEVGVMISRGMAEGILSGADFVRRAMESVGQEAQTTRRSGKEDGSVWGGSVTQNIYLRDSDASPYRTARRIRRESEAVFRN
ncbi:MAG: hypothetical protein ACI4V1_07095 [Eubacteriales bacterium]